MKTKIVALSISCLLPLSSVASVGTTPQAGSFVDIDDIRYGVYVQAGNFTSLEEDITNTAWYGDIIFTISVFDAVLSKYYPGETALPSDELRAASSYGEGQGYDGSDLLGHLYASNDGGGNVGGFINDYYFDVALTYTWLLSYLYGPNSADTLASMQRNAVALRNAFNLQSAKMAQGLSYDCSVFDTKNICVSFSGTRSDGKGGLDDTRGALIVAHKPNANVRFGGYIDQAFNSSESGGLKVKHSSPGYGVFAVWSEKADGSGLQVRGSASFGKADMESTRSEVGTAEAGFGKSDIKSDGFQIEASRHYAVNALWSARPYVGFRQLTNRRASYSERFEDGVYSPLSYSSIKQSTQSLLAGVRFARTISAQTTMTVAAGLEHDIKNDVDRYEATGVDDLGSIDMEDGKKNTRPTLSLGLTHVIDKAQRIGVSVTHRKEAFESGSTTSGMVQYSRGF